MNLYEKIHTLALRAQAHGSKYSLSYGHKIAAALRAEWGMNGYINHYEARSTETYTLESECGQWGVRLVLDATDGIAYVLTTGTVPPIEDVLPLIAKAFEGEVKDAKAALKHYPLNEVEAAVADVLYGDTLVQWSEEDRRRNDENRRLGIKVMRQCDAVRSRAHDMPALMNDLRAYYAA